MNKEMLNQIVSRPGMISGIFNYCDRWCERCPFTCRCANFAISESQFSDPESRDINNSKFWKNLEDVFKATFEMISEHAREMGIDLNADMTEIKEKIMRDDETARDEACFKVSEKYYKLVNKWFKDNEHVFNEKGKSLEATLRMELPGSDPESDALELKEAVEVIQFYQYFISAKLYRSLNGRLEEEDEKNDFPKDSEGSAKIALIAIDRSLAAWSFLLKMFTNKEDSILKILVLLQKLRNNAEAEFPDARKFIRPGFDE